MYHRRVGEIGMSFTIKCDKCGHVEKLTNENKTTIELFQEHYGNDVIITCKCGNEDSV